MSLQKILAKKSLIVVGLNSGTSADGLDMAAMRFNRSGSRDVITLLASRTRRFEKLVREAVFDVTDSESATLTNLIHLDNMLGVFFGRAAASFVKQLHKEGIIVDAIASHGQTVRHVPQVTKRGSYRLHGTLQLGSPERISALTGKPAIADFRQGDVALGGEGAPITVEAMRRLLADKRESRLIVNIGGMSNYFYFPKGGAPDQSQAADCGPGNVLCDLLSVRLYDEKYDRNGRRAASGSISMRLLSILLGSPFFHSHRSSTGREEFGPSLLEQMLVFAKRFKISKQDLMATAAELTVISIVNGVRHILSRDRSIGKLYLTGGGARNKFLWRRLQDALPGVEIGSTMQLGYDPNIVEAASFAVIGYAALRSQPMPTRFDGRGKRLPKPVLGRIVQPPRPA